MTGLPYSEKKYVKPFSSDTGALRTDRQTDGQITQMHNLSALYRRHLWTINDSQRLLATENQRLVKRHCQLSTAVDDSTHRESQCTVNHKFYLKVNNL